MTNLSRKNLVLNPWQSKKKYCFFEDFQKNPVCFRIQAVVGHAQTLFEFESLEGKMVLSPLYIEHYDGDITATSTHL